MKLQFFILTVLVSAVVAEDAYNRQSYSAPSYSAPAYKDSYAKSYDYVR